MFKKIADVMSRVIEDGYEIAKLDNDNYLVKFGFDSDEIAITMSYVFNKDMVIINAFGPMADFERESLVGAVNKFNMKSIGSIFYTNDGCLATKIVMPYKGCKDVILDFTRMVVSDLVYAYGELASVVYSIEEAENNNQETSSTEQQENTSTEQQENTSTEQEENISTEQQEMNPTE